MNWKVIVTLWVFALSVWVGASESAADEKLDPIVQQLLVDHWEKGKKNRDQSKKLFYESPATEQILMAYTLNRMAHNRYREARVPADELTKNFPKNLDGWALRIWLDAVTNNYDRSLISIQLMKRAMNRMDDLDDTVQDEMHAHAARILGYLQGPIAKQVNQTTLNTTLVKVVEGMTAEQLKKFNDERNRILDQYDQLVNQANGLQLVESQKEQNAATVEVAAIDVQNKAIDVRRQQIQPDINRVQQEGEQRVAAVEARLSPLEQELAGLGATIRSLEFTLQDIFREQVIQRELLLRERDPVIRAFIRDRLLQLDFDVNSVRNDLFNSRARANTVILQAENLAAELASLRQIYAGQLNRLTDEAKQNDRQQRRNFSRLQEIVKGTNGISPKVRTANNRIDALTTYFPFPLEMSRQDFVDSLTGN